MPSRRTVSSNLRQLSARLLKHEWHIIAGPRVRAVVSLMLIVAIGSSQVMGAQAQSDSSQLVELGDHVLGILSKSTSRAPAPARAAPPSAASGAAAPSAAAPSAATEAA